MKVYGYARISTKQQSIDRQIRNIKEADKSAIIRQEVFTGTNHQDRPEFNKLLKLVKKGDTIIFDSVSRMSRNAEEGFAEYKRLFDMGINLVFIKEPHINTDTYRQAIENKIQIAIDSGDDASNELMTGIIAALNTYMMKLAQKQIQLAFIQSEKEVQDLRQRTREGIVTAKMNGKPIGQPKGSKLTTKKSKSAKEIIRKHNKDFNGTLNNEDTRQLAKVSRMTYFKYKRELLTEASATP